MKSKSLRHIFLAVILFTSLLFPGLASAKELTVKDLQKLEGLLFDPVDMNDHYLAGNTSVSDHVWFLKRSTGEQYYIKLPKWTFVKNIKLVNHTIVYLTYESATGLSASNFKVTRYDIKTDSQKLLLKTNESLTLRAASDKGFIYTVDSINKGNDLYYFDFKTAKKTLIAKNIGSASLSGNLIAYSLVSSNLLDYNEEIYYVYTEALTKKSKLAYKGTEVQTNGQYIAFWYYVGASSTDRLVYIYNFSDKETYDYSYFSEGKSTNQNLVFGGKNHVIWNADNWQNKHYKTYINNLKDNTETILNDSLMPIAATSKEVLFFAPKSKTYYYLPF